MPNPLYDIPGYGGYLQKRQMNEESDARLLQMILGAQSLQDKMQERERRDTLSSAYSQAIDPGTGRLNESALYQRLAGTPAAMNIPQIQQSLAQQRMAEASLADVRGRTLDRQAQALAGIASGIYADPSDEYIQSIIPSLQQQVGNDTFAKRLLSTNDMVLRKRMALSAAMSHPEGVRALQAVQPKLTWEDSGSMRIPMDTNALSPTYGQWPSGVGGIQKSADPNTILRAQQNKSIITTLAGKGMRPIFDSDGNLVKIEDIPGGAPPRLTQLPLSDSSRKDLTEAGQLADQMQQQIKSFKPEFGGSFITGGLENTLKRWFPALENLDDTKGQADWWSAMTGLDNIVRHPLFGSAFTAPERKIWADTSVTPRDDPTFIQKNLERRGVILNRVMNRLANQMSVRHDPREVEALIKRAIVPEDQADQDTQYREALKNAIRRKLRERGLAK